MTDKKEEILNKDDITQLHGAQLLATKDGLLNEAKKHADISQLYADSQAKERAIGFAEWLDLNNWVMVYGGSKKAWICAEDVSVYVNGSDDYNKSIIEKHGKTTSELYTEYEVFTKKNKG